ncbi:hypothetical protein PHLCEN_2v2058 [Hermanssonia centrifuga]|uniref:Uncharacterized protein n=1 Tax=Hermanssonia centrifuga TaxID=98765 RepID=A0A2R6RQ84_9APHY|nr:hypothetical protein PHLCEN_2v2058 [Hermanssonia centrifuga]
MSGRKTLSASRSIVDLMYTLTATNFDVSLLDLQPFVCAFIHAIQSCVDFGLQMCWFMAGRVLVRFLRASIDEGIREQILLLQSQVSFVRTMLAKAGERVPLAYRYGKMLHDTLTNMCGEQFAEPIPEYLPPRGHYITAMSQHTNGDLPHTVEHIVL